MMTTGANFDLVQGTIDDINIEDIARALSNQCRYNGNVNRFYSVAEHCVLVSDYVLKKTKIRSIAYNALMHDAAEAYLGDLSGPLKKLLAASYEEVENRIEGLIARKFNLVRPWHEEIRFADDGIVFDEYKRLIEPEQGPCPWRSGGLGIKIHCWPPVVAEHRFLTAYNIAIGGIT